MFFTVRFFFKGYFYIVFNLGFSFQKHRLPVTYTRVWTELLTPTNSGFPAPLAPVGEQHGFRAADSIRCDGLTVPVSYSEAISTQQK